MQDTIDLLQIKINKAREELSEETRNAIDAVDWRAVILGMRETKGYNFEQLGDLELETELLLCGLVAPNDYPIEIQTRMRISKAEADELVKEMNNLVFGKIKKELMKNIKRVPSPFDKEEAGSGNLNSPHPNPLLIKERGNILDVEEEKNTRILNSAGIKIIPAFDILKATTDEDETEKKAPLIADLSVAPKIQTVQTGKLEINSPILTQKLSSLIQSTIVKTEHSLNNLSKTNNQNEAPVPPAPRIAPAYYPPRGDPYRLSPD